MTTKITDGNQLASHWYEQVEVVGRYEAKKVKRPGGGFSAIAVLGVDGELGMVYVDLFDRSADEAEQLSGKWVCVAGQIQPPMDQARPLHMAARDDLPALVSITSIDLADEGDLA